MKSPIRGVRTALSCIAAVALGAVGLTGCEPPPPYDVAVFGDVPYSESLEASYVRMIAAINRSEARFSTHLGDFKSSSSACTDANLEKNVGWFDSFARPLVYTPGDNEWLDCGSSRDTRLTRIREVVHRSDGALSRGLITRGLTSQASAGYPENARWTEPSVTFVTLHVVGGGDDQGRTQGRARRAADIAWLQAAFASARSAGHAGVVILSQDSPYGADGTVSTSYRSLADAVEAEVAAFSGQVLWMQGDGHSYLDDRPMRSSNGSTVTRFRRVQVEGDSKVSYVRLRVTPGSSSLFTITLSARF